MSDEVVQFPNLLQYAVATTRHLANAFFLGLLPPVIFSLLTWLVCLPVKVDAEVPAVDAEPEPETANEGQGGATAGDDDPAAVAAPAAAAVETVKVRRHMSSEEKMFAVAFAALGSLIGVFLGASRVGVVGAILPGVITLVSGYLAYLFSRDTKIINRHIIPVCILALIMSASAGAFYGGSMRTLETRADRLWEKHMIEFKELQIPLNKKVLEKQQEKALKEMEGK